MKHPFVIAVLSGIVFILAFMLCASIILTVIIKYTQMTEITFGYITFAIGILAYFIGGIVTGLKARKNGLLLGLFTGTSFSALTFLIQYLGYDNSFSTSQLIYHCTYVLVAIFGSIISVNITSKNHR